MIIKENKKILKKVGFTLVETLVAISVLSLSILGTFTAVQSGLSKSSFAKDQITAFYLIQEAMEYIRNVRDKNQLTSIYNISTGGSPVSWLSGVSELGGDPCYFGNTCRLDSNLKTLVNCSGSCPLLNQNSATGLYGYTSGGTWSATKFKREIQLQQINTNEIVVTVTISWASGVYNKTVQVKQTLLNIR